MKFSKIVNVIDIEATAWELPEVKGENEIQEIIEIGISTVNIDTLKLLDNQSILVKPQRSKISNFCTKLTTLTQEMVDTGISFQEACLKLRKEFCSSERTWVSWGDFDRKMFERNCRDYGVDYPFGPRHLNLKNCFTLLNGLSREPGLERAMEHLKLKMEGTHHRGHDDARNISTIFLDVLSKYRKE